MLLEPALRSDALIFVTTVINRRPVLCDHPFYMPKSKASAVNDRKHLNMLLEFDFSEE